MTHKNGKNGQSGQNGHIHQMKVVGWRLGHQKPVFVRGLLGDIIFILHCESRINGHPRRETTQAIEFNSVGWSELGVKPLVSGSGVNIKYE